MSGIYLSEYRGTRFASAVRFAADTLNGVPSIVIGVFAYGVAVLPFKHFSMLAGGLALGIMMIPLIARTTEELLLLVPNALREGALALGATRAKAVMTVLVPAALLDYPGSYGTRPRRRGNGAAVFTVRQRFFDIAPQRLSITSKCSSSDSPYEDGIVGLGVRWLP